jgi:hypothetical protein
MSQMIRHYALLVVAACCVAAGGCCGGGAVLSGQATLPAGESSSAFLDRVSSSPTVSENNAFRGVLMLLDGTDSNETFAQRVEALEARGIVRPCWNFDADRPVTKGRLAYMIYKAANVPGGVTLTLFGPSEWYCLKELQYQGFMTPGAVYADVTGMQYVGVLNRTDGYMQTGEIPDVLKVGQ